MNPESSPFTPGQPVPVEFFVGRIAEIERLRGMVAASARGRFRIGFVSGERGIGKSSLAAFVRRLVEEHDDTLGCHVFLGGVQDLGEMLRQTFNSLLKQSVSRPWHRQTLEFFGDRVRKVGLFGVSLELDLRRGELESMERNFAASIRQLAERTGRKSILLILDDINGLAGSQLFANWLKSFVDEIATSRETTKLCAIVVGLEERRRELVSRQPSLARVFELIDIAPWSDNDVSDFYQQSFRAGNATVSVDDVERLVSFTGGLPVLAHEIGDAVWRAAAAPEVTTRDTMGGIIAAAEVIGLKFLDPQIVEAIYSERYLSILRKIARQKPLEMRFRRAELLGYLTDTEGKVLDNFLQRMKKLGAVEPDPGVRGGYRYPNRLYAMYFPLAALRASTP